MMSKKAFEVQFNWMFVLVAGAAILLFFTAVVVKQKSVSETSTKATVLKSMEAIITGASISTDTTNIIDIPNSNIEVGCGRVSVGSVSKQFQSLILYAPGILKGDKLITQTLAFNVPYRATNLLFVASPQLRYIIVGNNELAKEINKLLPSELKKEFYTVQPEIKNSNNYKVRFVLFNDMIGFPKELAKMPDSDVTAVKVDGNSEKGNIEFYQKEGNSWLFKGESTYLGKSSLIGAVYADTLDVYECNMQNTFYRLGIVTKIYIERTKKLMQAGLSETEYECPQFYSNALAQLNRIFSSADFNDENVDTIADASKSLANENKNAQLYSCTLIY